MSYFGGKSYGCFVDHFVKTPAEAAKESEERKARKAEREAKKAAQKEKSK